jgi:hypothetical protein
MAQFPYIYNVSKLKALLTKIRQVGVPNKADQKWLATLSFTSSHDRSVLTLLKFIGFLDPAGAPTETWRQYRASESQAVLGAAVKTGYGELFSTFPDAHHRPDAELKSFLKAQSGAGEDAITKTLATFKALCEMSDFDGVESGRTPTKAVPSLEGVDAPEATVELHQAAAAPVTININIQLSLPETKDEEVYDHFFAALKRHLVDQNAVVA